MRLSPSTAEITHVLSRHGHPYPGIGSVHAESGRLLVTPFFVCPRQIKQSLVSLAAFWKLATSESDRHWLVFQKYFIWE